MSILGLVGKVAKVLKKVGDLLRSGHGRLKTVPKNDGEAYFFIPFSFLSFTKLT